MHQSNYNSLGTIVRDKRFWWEFMEDLTSCVTATCSQQQVKLHVREWCKRCARSQQQRTVSMCCCAATCVGFLADKQTVRLVCLPFTQRSEAETRITRRRRLRLICPPAPTHHTRCLRNNMSLSLCLSFPVENRLRSDIVALAKL